MKLLDLEAQRTRLDGGIERAIERVLKHGNYIMGPEVAELEESLCAFGSADEAITCSSGTDALLLILMALELGPGDAVVVPAFTFPATAEVIKLIGATPVFCDVDPASAIVTAAHAAEGFHLARTLGLRPQALMAVDMYGQPADYVSLGEVADEWGAALIADAAQSFGGSDGDRPVGSLAPFTATSFFPAKPLGCYGDGGAVLCKDPGLANRMRSLRAHGKGDHKYAIDRVGINGRLDTLQAAVLLEKLTIFVEELTARRRIANRYNQTIPLHARISERSGTLSAHAQYVVKLDDRDAAARYLAEAGIPTAVHYPAPLPAQPAYADCPVVPSIAASSELAAQVLSLPLHPYLSDSDVDKVLTAGRSLWPDG